MRSGSIVGRALLGGLRRSWRERRDRHAGQSAAAVAHQRRVDVPRHGRLERVAADGETCIAGLGEHDGTRGAANFRRLGSHIVAVGESAFTYKGKEYKSLSAIAKVISGTPWNGYGFFGLLAKETK